MKTHQLNFTFPQYFYSCHVDNEVYICGGYNGNYLRDCRKIKHDGEYLELQKMPNPKYVFPLVYWIKRLALFTIGGHCGSAMKEVTEYSIEKDTWKMYSQLPEAIYGSSAVILDHTIYNIGGNSSTHSILWCDLSSAPVWSPLEIPNHSFKN